MATQHQHQHHIASTKIAGFIGLFVGVIAAIASFVTKNPNTAIVLGSIGAVVSIFCMWKSRKNIDDMQLATAGLFMAVVSVVVGLWLIYS
ncbi:MAG TPA: hypothetical protein VGD35_14640 [Chitinophaga sp.]